MEFGSIRDEQTDLMKSLGPILLSNHMVTYPPGMKAKSQLHKIPPPPFLSPSLFWTIGNLDNVLVFSFPLSVTVAAASLG